MEAKSTIGTGWTAKDNEGCTGQSRTDELSPGDSDIWRRLYLDGSQSTYVCTAWTVFRFTITLVLMSDL